MIKRGLTILMVCFALPVFSQGEDHQLYDHELDENKWKEIREGIRYEGHERENSAGRQWTYESNEAYEKAKKNKGGGGGNGTGGTGSGASEPRSTSSPRSSRIRPPSMSSPGLGGLGIIGYILLFVFIAALVVLLFYLFINAPKKGKKVEGVEIDMEDVNPTEIPLTELERMLQEAISRGDYRGAIRIYFIFIIRDLAEKKWIRWEKEKTNFQYLREMSGKAEFDDFNRSVSYFEVIWYGKRELDQQKFNQVKPSFTNLLNKLGVK
ncbi:MAG: hypothetical protein WDZ35_01405 [Crocinitomicaceae bacterium]